MTLPSKSTQIEQSDVEKNVISALEQSNANMDDAVLSDIAQARLQAIQAAKDGKSGSTISQWLGRAQEWLRYDLLVDNYKFATPLAVAVVVTVLVSYNQDNSVPVLPVELLSGDVPTEELAMLEDLEFASWLAEQQQEGHL